MNEDIQYLEKYEKIILDGKEFTVEALPFPDRNVKRSIVLSRNQELYWLTPYDNAPDYYLLTTLGSPPKVPMNHNGECVEALIIGNIIEDITGLKLDSETI
jgi:hypothetical protein